MSPRHDSRRWVSIITSAWGNSSLGNKDSVRNRASFCRLGVDPVCRYRQVAEMEGYDLQRHQPRHKVQDKSFLLVLWVNLALQTWH